MSRVSFRSSTAVIGGAVNKANGKVSKRVFGQYMRARVLVPAMRLRARARTGVRQGLLYSLMASIGAIWTSAAVPVAALLPTMWAGKAEAAAVFTGVFPTDYPAADASI